VAHTITNLAYLAVQVVVQRMLQTYTAEQLQKVKEMMAVTHTHTVWDLAAAAEPVVKDEIV
jgi:hypothetical protein